MNMFLEIILASAVCFVGCLGVDWCSKDLECDGAPNTMCTYKAQTETADCKGLTDAQTAETRKAILDMHNEYRNNIAGGNLAGWPKAANMRQMVWDDEVESVALRWALQCVAGHDICRATTKFPSVGQNYGLTAISGTQQFPDQKDIFNGWVDEIKLIADPKSFLSSFEGGKWGHFTQVAWAESYALGCGLIHYEKSSFQTTVVICNYGPAGNMLSTKMYEEGEPTSMCPSGTKKSEKYPNLCDGGGDDTTTGSSTEGGGDSTETADTDITKTPDSSSTDETVPEPTTMETTKAKSASPAQFKPKTLMIPTAILLNYLSSII